VTNSILPPETRIGRVALRVADLASPVEFYRDVIGLTVQERTPERAVLGAGDPLLVLDRVPDLPDRPETAAGLFHLAVRVPSREALGDALARVEEGWQLTGASDHGVSEALYLRDPEGNGVEIYRDRERAAWPTAAHGVEMDTRPLDLDALRAAVAGDAPDRVPGDTDIGHVHLEVTSLPEAQAFYVDSLGLGVRQEWGDDALFVAAGDYHHHVGLNTWNGRTTATEGRGLDWFELVVPDGETLAGVRDRLAGAGAPISDSGNGLAVEDPDGIEIRLR
jgi:catechol 2,3-dioxygenase